jgi:hypothetical protein
VKGTKEDNSASPFDGEDISLVVGRDRGFAEQLLKRVFINIEETRL